VETKPKAVEYFEEERSTADESASMFLEHPLDRLKYHITHTGGKIIKSEFSVDGLAYVIWECDGRRYRAWSSWPGPDYTISWKTLP
jgi:hypothetical protein